MFTAVTQTHEATACSSVYCVFYIYFFILLTPAYTVRFFSFISSFIHTRHSLPTLLSCLLCFYLPFTLIFCLMFCWFFVILPAPLHFFFNCAYPLWVNSVNHTIARYDVISMRRNNPQIGIRSGPGITDRQTDQKRDRWPQTHATDLDRARDTKLSAPTVFILVN